MSNQHRGSKEIVTVEGITYEIIFVDQPGGYAVSWKCSQCETSWSMIFRVDGPEDAKQAVVDRIRQHQMRSHWPGRPE